MAKKKKKESPYVTWMVIGLFITMLALAILRNYFWLEKQDSKPFGYKPLQIAISNDQK